MIKKGLFLGVSIWMLAVIAFTGIFALAMGVLTKNPSITWGILTLMALFFLIKPMPFPGVIKTGIVIFFTLFLVVLGIMGQEWMSSAREDAGATINQGTLEHQASANAKKQYSINKGTPYYTIAWHSPLWTPWGRMISAGTTKERKKVEIFPRRKTKFNGTTYRWVTLSENGVVDPNATPYLVRADKLASEDEIAAQKSAQSKAEEQQLLDAGWEVGNAKVFPDGIVGIKFPDGMTDKEVEFKNFLWTRAYARDSNGSFKEIFYDGSEHFTVVIGENAWVFLQAKNKKIPDKICWKRR